MRRATRECAARTGTGQYVIAVGDGVKQVVGRAAGPLVRLGGCHEDVDAAAARLPTAGRRLHVCTAMNRISGRGGQGKIRGLPPLRRAGLAVHLEERE